MLDIVFSNIPELIDDLYIDTTSGLKSDHHPVTIKLGVNTTYDVSRPNTRLIYKLYSATEDTWASYRQQIQILSNTWISWLKSLDNTHSNKKYVINIVYNQLMNIIHDSADNTLRRKKQSSTSDEKHWWNANPLIQSTYTELTELQSALHSNRHDSNLKQQYNDKHQQFISLARHSKQQSWIDLCNKMQDPQNQQLVWATWKLASSDGRVSLGSHQSLNNMCSAFSDITRLDKPDTLIGAKNYVSVTNHVNTIRRYYQYNTQSTDSNDIMDQLFTVDEIRKSAARMQGKTAAGPDELPALLIKRGGIQLYKLLVELFNYSWRYSVLSDEWKQANVVALYKGKGERTDPTSYRPISVTSVMIRSELY